MKNKRAVGKQWETFAVSYLINKGYTVINENFYTAYGEIDIIAEKENFIVFIEVKYRSSHRYGTPGAAVTFKKQERIRNAALVYLEEHKISLKDVRFDVIEITGGKEIVLEHIVNAF